VTGSSTLRVTIEDPRCEAAVLLCLRVVAELAARYPEEAADAALPDDVDGPRGAFVIAWLDGQPAGCGALRPLSPGVAEVKRMYVEPALRGRGIARIVLERLEAAACELGYSSVWLETGIRQPEAIRLYERAGYHRIPCYGTYAGSALSVCFEKHIGK
jgi:putative acetyltransferase